MANAGYDFIWTEMQHASTTWDQATKAWRTCPNAKAVPGVRVPYTDEFQIQHALDAGALVLVVPTVDTVEEAIAAQGLGVFPAARQAQPRRRRGIRSQYVGQCARAATATPSTTISC